MTTERDLGQARDDSATQAATEVEAASSPPAAAGSMRSYLRGYVVRLRSGDTGVLPVIVGLLVIGIVFESLNANFLTAGNLVNLMIQGASYMLLGMAAVFTLLLGEVDLSLGFVAGVGGVAMAIMVTGGMPWWGACLLTLVFTAAIGAFQGSIIAKVGVPSFVVTLAGLLGWEGVMLLILGNGGTVPINDSVIVAFANGKLPVAAGWIIWAVGSVAFAGLALLRDTRRRRSGLAAPPVALTLVKIAVAVAAGAVVVGICSLNRGALIPIRGVPWVVLITLGMLLIWTFLIGRTRFGRYVYAVGGSAEAARRAGVNLARIRITGFLLGSMTAGIAGIIFASRLRSVSTNFDGGVYVLYAIAAAVIGGTSLFGGRGKILHGLLGGLVIAGIDNGMGLLGLSAAVKFVVTALVLLAAVTVDALARRGRRGGGLPLRPNLLRARR